MELINVDFPSKDKLLEFYWQPKWQHPSNSDESRAEPSALDNVKILTHTLAKGYYDIPNTCGPDNNICETFDFENPRHVFITNANLVERAATLADQFRKKSGYFKHPYVMVPYGDDFKYKTREMTATMWDNLQLLVDEINKTPGLKMTVRWSTLSTYFERIAQFERDANRDLFPVWRGDFLPYDPLDLVSHDKIFGSE
jgi:alpha-mannosidase II